MAKMVAMPIYDKTPLKIFFTRSRRPEVLGMSNHDSKLTLTYLT